MKNLENFESRFNISSRKIHNDETYVYMYMYIKREKERERVVIWKNISWPKTGSG